MNHDLLGQVNLFHTTHTASHPAHRFLEPNFGCALIPFKKLSSSLLPYSLGNMLPMLRSKYGSQPDNRLEGCMPMSARKVMRETSKNQVAVTFILE